MRINLKQNGLIKGMKNDVAQARGHKYEHGQEFIGLQCEKCSHPGEGSDQGPWFRTSTATLVIV